MTKDYKYPILYSLLIHILPFISFALKHKPGGEGDAEKSSSKVHISVVEKLPEHSKITKQKKDDCEKWYGGIGVEFGEFFSKANISPNQITKVFKGYPADGVLLVGDIIESNVETIKGEPGTSSTIKIIRNNQHLVFILKRDKICIMDNGKLP
jgi:hypothetical protein